MNLSHSSVATECDDHCANQHAEHHHCVNQNYNPSATNEKTVPTLNLSHSSDDPSQNHCCANDHHQPCASTNHIPSDNLQCDHNCVNQNSTKRKENGNAHFNDPSAANEKTAPAMNLSRSYDDPSQNHHCANEHAENHQHCVSENHNLSEIINTIITA